MGIPSALLLFTLFVWNPGWHGKVLESTENKFTWKKLNLVSAGVSLVLSLMTAALATYGNVQDISSAALVTSIATMAFVLVQTYVTDTKMRYADRGTLRFATIMAFASSLTYYLYNDSFIAQFEMYAWIIAFVAATLLLYMPGFGSSDGRAIALAVAAAVPVVGVIGVAFSMVFYAIAALVFVVWIVLKYKVSSIAYVNHISIPAVPFLLFPFLLVTVYAAFDITFGLGWLDLLLGWIPDAVGAATEQYRS